MKLHVLQKIRAMTGTNIAMDLGTANTLVYTKSGGIVLD